MIQTKNGSENRGSTSLRSQSRTGDTAGDGTALHRDRLGPELGSQPRSQSHPATMAPASQGHPVPPPAWERPDVTVDGKLPRDPGIIHGYKHG